MKQLFAISLSALMLTGCTTLTTESPPNLSLKLEKTDSWIARISTANITSANPGLWVRGSVVRLLPGKGPIYGHLHIDLFDGNGKKLAGAITKPMRTNQNSRRARFAKSFRQEQTTQKSAVVKLTHHAERHKHS